MLAAVARRARCAGLLPCGAAATAHPETGEGWLLGCRWASAATQTCHGSAMAAHLWSGHVVLQPTHWGRSHRCHGSLLLWRLTLCPCKIVAEEADLDPFSQCKACVAQLCVLDRGASQHVSCPAVPWRRGRVPTPLPQRRLQQETASVS